MRSIALVFSLICFASKIIAEEIDITTLADSGPGSLRDAITNAIDNDLLIFDPSLSGTIFLLSPLPPVNALIEILGNGQVTIDGGSTNQIFQINVDCTISDLTLANSDISTPGGAASILSDATLILTNVTFPNCESGCQCPIYIQSDAELITSDLIFESATPDTPAQDIQCDSGSSAVLTCDVNTQPVVWLNGTLNLFKRGPGTMYICAASLIDLSLVVDNGTAIFLGTSTDELLINPNGTLIGGNAQFIGNAGTFKPSLTTGTIATAGDYYQTSQATLQIAITPSGVSDVLNAGGYVWVHGELLIIPSSGIYTSGTQYTFLTSGNGVSREFSTISCTEPGLEVVVEYMPNSLTLTVLNDFTIP